MEGFKGETYVAFMDIAGFKSKSNERKKKMIDEFYSTVYNLTMDVNKSVPGKVDAIRTIVLSDSALFFVGRKFKKDKEAGLLVLLRLIRKVNRSLIKNGILTFTGLAFGPLNYSEPSERKDLRNVKLHGDGYIKAFLLSEDAEKKIPGYVSVHTSVANRVKGRKAKDEIGLIRSHLRVKRFYWMLSPGATDKQFNAVNAARKKHLEQTKGKNPYSSWTSALVGLLS